MKASENVPPGSNYKKAIYMNTDLKRNAEMFGTKQLRIPKDFPGNSIFAQRVLTAIKLKYPELLSQISLDLWDLYWTNRLPLDLQNITQQVISRLGETKGCAIIEMASSQQVKDELIARTNDAIELGAFGVPWFHVEFQSKSQVFFGSDRMEAIAHFLNKKYQGVFPKL